LPKVAGSQLSQHVGIVGTWALPLLGLAQTTTWLSAMFAKVVARLAVITANSEAISASANWATQRANTYRTVSTLRANFFVVFLTLLGGDMAIPAFVDYAVYFLGEGKDTKATGRDEL
jgi:hypothetical protein